MKSEGGSAGDRVDGGKAEVVFLRGLSARLEWVADSGSTKPEGSSLAEWSARGQGYEDYFAGRLRSDVPPLLADVQALAECWRDGWDNGREVEGLDLDED